MDPATAGMPGAPEAAGAPLKDEEASKILDSLDFTDIHQLASGDEELAGGVLGFALPSMPAVTSRDPVNLRGVWKTIYGYEPGPDPLYEGKLLSDIREGLPKLAGWYLGTYYNSMLGPAKDKLGLVSKEVPEEPGWIASQNANWVREAWRRLSTGDYRGFSPADPGGWPANIYAWSLIGPGGRPSTNEEMEEFYKEAARMARAKVGGEFTGPQAFYLTATGLGGLASGKRSAFREALVQGVSPEDRAKRASQVMDMLRAREPDIASTWHKDLTASPLGEDGRHRLSGAAAAAWGAVNATVDDVMSSMIVFPTRSARDLSLSEHAASEPASILERNGDRASAAINSMHGQHSRLNSYVAPGDGDTMNQSTLTLMLSREDTPGPRAMTPALMGGGRSFSDLSRIEPSSVSMDNSRYRAMIENSRGPIEARAPQPDGTQVSMSYGMHSDANRSVVHLSDRSGGAMEGGGPDQTSMTLGLDERDVTRGGTPEVLGGEPEEDEEDEADSEAEVKPADQGLLTMSTFGKPRRSYFSAYVRGLEDQSAIYGGEGVILPPTVSRVVEDLANQTFQGILEGGMAGRMTQINREYLSQLFRAYKDGGGRMAKKEFMNQFAPPAARKAQVLHPGMVREKMIELMPQAWIEARGSRDFLDAAGSAYARSVVNASAPDHLKRLQEGLETAYSLGLSRGVAVVPGDKMGTGGRLSALESFEVRNGKLEARGAGPDPGVSMLTAMADENDEGLGESRLNVRGVGPVGSNLKGSFRDRRRTAAEVEVVAKAPTTKDEGIGVGATTKDAGVTAGVGTKDAAVGVKAAYQPESFTARSTRDGTMKRVELGQFAGDREKWAQYMSSRPVVWFDRGDASDEAVEEVSNYLRSEGFGVVNAAEAGRLGGTEAYDMAMRGRIDTLYDLIRQGRAPNTGNEAVSAAASKKTVEEEEAEAHREASIEIALKQRANRAAFERQIRTVRQLKERVDTLQTLVGNAQSELEQYQRFKGIEGGEEQGNAMRRSILQTVAQTLSAVRGEVVPDAEIEAGAANQANFEQSVTARMQAAREDLTQAQDEYNRALQQLEETGAALGREDVVNQVRLRDYEDRYGKKPISIPESNYKIPEFLTTATQALGATKAERKQTMQSDVVAAALSEFNKKLRGFAQMMSQRQEEADSALAQALKKHNQMWASQIESQGAQYRNLAETVGQIQKRGLQVVPVHQPQPDFATYGIYRASPFWFRHRRRNLVKRPTRRRGRHGSLGGK